MEFSKIKDNTKFENLSQGFQLQLLQDEKLKEKVYYFILNTRIII